MLWRRSKAAHGVDVDARFLLANERTLLAWVRTGLALIGGGVAVGVLATSHPQNAVVSLGTILMGALVNLVGYLRYRQADNAIRAGELPPTGVGGLLVVIGVTCFAAAVFVITQVLNR